MSEKQGYFTRMGDGSGLYMTAEEIRCDIEAGIHDAMRRGKIDGLTEAEKNHLFDIIVMDGNVVGVTRGQEVVSTSDSGCFKLNYQAHVPMDRSTAVLINERVLGLDSVDIGNIDYSYKTVKPILHDEAKVMEIAQSQAVIPVLYGGMPDLGRYTKPDGPVDNWSELLPMGKIDEAKAAQEEAVEHAVKDMVYIAKGMAAAGADGMNLDTSGASGDADFLAALKAIEAIKAEHPDFGIEIGMAGEFVMGMHGGLKYDGVRLAGLYPHKQVKLAEKAGANIFGPVVNTNCNKSFAWNIARAVTFIKACSEAAEIPVHVNVGMGVGGTPMAYVPPTDVVSKAAKAMAEIAKIDGL
ncbi:dimethylamine:corrinoid methyltransferase [uncultured Eubacterium sp.]|nr:dimethylamine:corrinoid methyltransferase [uncultured Eubacterium sp.]